MGLRKKVKLHYWTPRVLAILLIIFVSSFALDVFGQKDWLLALLVHLIPSFFLAILTVIAWRNEQLGGFLFILAGILFLAVSRMEAFVLYVPALALGILFILGGLADGKLHT